MLSHSFISLQTGHFTPFKEEKDEEEGEEEEEEEGF